MSSDARAASGAKVTFEWGGVKYKLSQLTLAMYGELSAVLASKRLGILSQVANNLKAFPDRHHGTLIDSAVKQASISDGVSSAAFEAFASSPEGMCELLAKMLAPDSPGMTAAQVNEIFKDLPMGMIKKLVTEASGMADAKN